MVRSLLLSLAAVLILVATAAAGERTLGFTVDDLPRLLQASFDKAGSPLRVGWPSVKRDGNHDVFVLRISPEILLGGTVERASGRVLRMVASLDLEAAKDKSAGLKYIMCATAVVDVCSPGLTGAQRDAVLRDIGLAQPSMDPGKVLESSLGQVLYRHLWTESEATFGASPR